MSEPGGTKQANPANPLVALLLRGALFGSVIKIASVGLTFVFFLVIARATTPEEYGIFASAFSLATILGFAAALGQEMSILRFWPTIEEQHGDRVAAAAIRRGFGFVLFGGGFVFAVFSMIGFLGISVPGLGPDPEIYTWVGAMCLAFAVSEFFVSALRAKGALLFALMPREIAWRAAVILLVLMGFAGAGSVGILAVTAMALVCVTMLQLFPLAVDLMARSAYLPKDVSDNINSAAPGFFGVTVSNQLISHGSTVVIAMTLGPASAGAFFAADRLAKLLSIVLIGVNQIAGPHLAREHYAGRSANVQMISSAVSLFAFSAAALGFVAYLVLGRFALSVFDESYADVFWALVILSLGQLINTACGVNGLLLTLAGRERLLFRLVLAWGVPGLLLTYFAGLWLGLTGGVIAVALTMAGWNITAVWFCRRELGIDTVGILTAVSSIGPKVMRNGWGPR